MYNSDCCVCGQIFDGRSPTAKYCTSVNCQAEKKETIRQRNTINKRKWRAKNKDYDKKYYEENKEAVTETVKKYVKKNKVEVLAKRKEWRDNNKERQRRKDKRWYSENKERRKAQSKEHRESDPLLYKINNCCYHQIGTIKNITIEEKKAIFISTQFNRREKEQIELIKKVVEYE